MGQIKLVCGAEFSGRGAYLDGLWRDHLDEALFLAPTGRYAWMRQEAFVRKFELPGLWGMRAWKLGAFTQVLLEVSGRQVHMVSALERQIMARRAVEAALQRPSAPPVDVTPGLVRHLLRVITALKQAAIEPDQFREAVERGGRSATSQAAVFPSVTCERVGEREGTGDGDAWKRVDAGAFDVLVAETYEGYQSMLIARGRYDVPGLFWEADQICQAESVAMPNGASMILLDGFDDFTPSEQRFLVTLSRHVEAMFIGLNYDPDPDRSDLFYLQQRCVEAFQRRAEVELTTFPTEPPSTRARFVARHLFWRNPPPEAEGLRGGLRIMACADAQHEMETIGRRVKRLLTCGDAPANAVAVALTDMDQHVYALHDVLEGFGVPHTIRGGPSLLNTTIGASIMGLFEAFHEWDAAAVVALLSSPLLPTAPDERELVMAIPLIARHAGVISGRMAWLHGLERLERRLEREETLPESERLPVPRPQEALRLFRQRLAMLMAASDEMASCTTLREYTLCLDRQITTFNLEAAMDTVNSLRALLEQLAAMDRAEEERMEQAVFLQILRDGMQETRVALDSAFGPGVICANIEGLRHEKFAHIFMGGLNEGLLPCPAAVNAIYSETDIRRLRGMGLDLQGRHEHAFRERLRFHHALCAVDGDVTLSWRKLDDAGREALPSPVVVDIRELFGSAVDIAEPEPGPDCFIADAEHVASPRDLANLTYYQGHDELEAYFSELLAPVKVRAAVESGRNSDGPFDHYDGVIEAPDLLEWINERYGDIAQFSVSQIERYNAFPFHFFIEQLLRIRETHVPEGELDPLTRGIVLHEVLQAFHERYRGLGVNEILALHDAEARAFMASCVADAFSRHAWRMTATPEVVQYVEQRRLVLVLNRYLDRESDRDDGEFKPRCFELAFGRVPRENQDIASNPAPFTLEVNGAAYRFSGKIDRLDVSDDGAARIIDYKTSSTPQRKAMVQGLDLQLTVYSWAVERHLLPGDRCVEAWYLPIYKGKPVEALTLNKPDDAAARLAAAEAHIAGAIDGIRSGKFPPLPHEALSSSDADFHVAARYEAWRIQRKCPEYMPGDETAWGGDT